MAARSVHGILFSLDFESFHKIRRMVDNRHRSRAEWDDVRRQVFRRRGAQFHADDHGKKYQNGG